MEKLVRLIETKRIDPSLMLTHRFEGLKKVEEELLLMKDKPQDMIKPVITITYQTV